MDRYARLVHRHARAILIAIAALSVALSLRLPLGYDDDVVRFLPKDDPEVAAFERISSRFGSLDVALVAVSATDGSDLFTRDRLAYVRALSERLRALPEVAHVTSLTELAIIEGGAEGSQVALVPHDLPSDPAALAALRDTALGLDYVAGVLVARDASALLLVTQLRTRLPGGAQISSKRAAEAVKAALAALPAPAATTLHHGGAPFIAEAAANGSQEDLARLAPYVVGITLALIVLSLGSLLAALYTVLAVGLAILWTLGLMGWLGLPLTLVSTSLPVILVALGSAYAVHLLVWYREHGADPVAAVRHLGAPIVITAATTVAGFLSFLAMDLAPMREFGWQMALGTALCALLALTLIPALLAVLPLRPRRSPASGGLGRALDARLVRFAQAARRRRWPILALALGLAAALAPALRHVDTRMNTSAFFAADSAPARADALLADAFGGSVFLQVMVDGDLGDPAALHRLAAFVDRLHGVPGVTRVDSIDRVLAVAHEGLKETRRLSRSRDEIALLGSLARMTDPSVALLVDREWRGALVQIGLGGFDTGKVDAITRAIRALAAAHLDGPVAAFPREQTDRSAAFADAAERVAALARRPPSDHAALAAALARAVDAAAAHELQRAVRGVLEVEVVEDEMVTLADGADWRALADALGAELARGALDKPRFAALLAPAVTAAEREDEGGLARASDYLFTKVDLAAEAVQRDAFERELGPLLAGVEPGRRLRVAAIVDELRQPTWYGPPPAGASASTPLSATVSGQPILQEAMTRSVQHNQTLSLALSLPLVLVLMMLVFKSALAGLIGLIPAALTLLVTFGLMGLFPEHLPMDIAASMLSSIALGVGIDYAIHFMWRYRDGGLDGAMRTTGRAIVINAAEITGAFGVLAWATIAPMSRFGLLIAETLLVAALATLVLLPPLLSFWSPRARSAAPPLTPGDDDMLDAPHGPAPRLKAAAPLILLALALAAAPSAARADAYADARAKGAQELLVQSDQLANHYKSQQWKMRMTITPKGGESRVLEFRIWQKDQKDRLVRFDAPGEVKGLSMLSNGADVMYVYSPQTDNVRRVASHAKRQTLLGSNLNYDDMGSIDLSAAYTAALADETPTHQWLALTAKPGAEVGWATLRVRIAKDTAMADLIEYHEGGKLKRTQSRTAFERLGGVPTYRKIEVRSLDDGLVTTLEVLEQKIGEDLPDAMFKKKNLVRGG